MIALPLVAYLTLKPRVTVENYQQIYDGMTMADVEALLGRPTGDPIPAVNFLFLCSSAGTLREEYAAFQVADEGLQWQDSGGSILVGFSPGGTVTYKRYDPRYDESPLDMARRWFAKHGW